ncbi:MAG: GtrA family protein [Dysgonamonadaceae bacterium]|jgi:putative flippase GtrA|nr:GtrA family protein [Dysgonamonadaceae bacterium]
MNRKFFFEALKYGIIGVFNTLLTAIIIWLMMHLVFRQQQGNDASAEVVSISNIVGYVAGLINSFIWNRKWTFKSKSAWKRDFMRFIFAFLICYIPQLLLVNVLNNYADIKDLEINFLERSYCITSAYLCQLAGIVFFTVMNFLCNKYFTFRRGDE